ncbi:MAG: hypothetical protein IJV02_06415 [Candidatus Methanomethylophilaceae archaeon]|nr:hypothetical protein [Candidatus Methanomethylophilaceae archaeon]
MILYRQGFKDGSFTPESSLISAYGVYLMNGGTPEGFDSMTDEDVQIMLTTYHGMQQMQAHRIVMEFAKWMGGKE